MPPTHSGVLLDCKLIVEYTRILLQIEDKQMKRFLITYYIGGRGYSEYSRGMDAREALRAMLDKYGIHRNYVQVEVIVEVGDD
jgi:hypothetical protein